MELVDVDDEFKSKSFSNKIRKLIASKLRLTMDDIETIENNEI